MSTDTVEEPTVVADYHGATCKLLQTFLKGTERVYVDIIGRLVEEEHVALFLQCHGKVQTVSFTTREHTAFLLLVGTREIETGEISTHIDVTATHTDEFVATAYHVIYALVCLNVLMLLVHIRHLHGLTALECARVSSLQSHDNAEEGSLSCTVRTDNTYYAVRRKHEVEILEEHFVAE